jgi:hypothetical protein
MPTIEFFTGFEGCGSTNDVSCFLSSIESSKTIYSATGGYDNGKCLRTDKIYGFTKSCSAAKTKCSGLHVIGFGTHATNSTGYPLFQFVGPDIRVLNTPDGLKVYKGAVTLLGSCAVVIESTLVFIECKVFSNSSTGTVTIKNNGVEVLALTDVNTGGQDITSITWGGPGNATYRYSDNIYIADDFCGEMKSVLLKPSSDSSVQLTPNSGDVNYDRVNQTAQDGDTTYNSSATVNHTDLFEYEDLSSSFVPKVVTMVTVARKEGADGKNLQMIAKQGESDYNIGSAFALSDGYPAALGAGKFNILNTAPDTQAWDRTILNAIKWGYKVAE